MKKQTLLVVSIFLLGCAIVSAQTPTVPKQIAGGVVNGKATNLVVPDVSGGGKSC